MASTYTPQEALLFAKSFIKKMPIDTDANLIARMLDYAASLVWTAAPWSWTLGTLANVVVNGSLTDYVVTPPADFLYLTKAHLTDGSTQNPIEVVPQLPATITQVGVPSQVAYLSGQNLVRVNPKPPVNYNQTLVAIYKKQPPKITAVNYVNAGVQLFPDCYFPVFQAGVLWLAYLYADDSRAGSATVTDEGKIQYTQQLGTFQSMLWEMRRAEKLPLEYPGKPITKG